MCRRAQRLRSTFARIQQCFSWPPSAGGGCRDLVFAAFLRLLVLSAGPAPAAAGQSPLTPVRSSPRVLRALLQENLGENLHFHWVLHVWLYCPGHFSSCLLSVLSGFSVQREWGREALRRGTGRMCFTGQTSLPSVLVWVWGWFCFVSFCLFWVCLFFFFF